jgi:hypothetical protein
MNPTTTDLIEIDLLDPDDVGGEFFEQVIDSLLQGLGISLAIDK